MRDAKALLLIGSLTVLCLMCVVMVCLICMSGFAESPIIGLSEPVILVVLLALIVRTSGKLKVALRREAGGEEGV